MSNAEQLSYEQRAIFYINPYTSMEKACDLDNSSPLLYAMLVQLYFLKHDISVESPTIKKNCFFHSIFPVISFYGILNKYHILHILHRSEIDEK